MTEQPKEEKKIPDEEKSKEELLSEIKNLRNEIDKLNDDMEHLRSEVQGRDMKISFFEQTCVLQNGRINEYRKTIEQLKKEIEDLKTLKAEEYYQKKKKN